MSANRADGLFQRTVETLLDSAFDDARWGNAFAAMDRLCDLNGGQLTAMAANPNGEVEATFGACYINGDPREEIVADWVENYSAYSENVPRIGKLPTWRLTHNEELFTAAEKRNSLMYNEFQPKYDCGDQVAVVVDRPSRGPRRNDYLMWTMKNGGRGWDPDKLNRISGLLPHIRQAVRLRQELAIHEAEAYADVSRLVEDSTLGVVFLDRRGTVALANPNARKILGSKAGVFEWHGDLRASLPRDDVKLRTLIGAALPGAVEVAMGGRMSVRRPVGLPLILHVHPVTPVRMDFGAERLAVLVLLRDPDVNTFDPVLVGEVLGLTPAESRVAVLLAMGRSVRDIALEIDRSEHTVRWTLKNALWKTNSSRQSDLVRLVVRLPSGEAGT